MSPRGVLDVMGVHTILSYVSLFPPKQGTKKYVGSAPQNLAQLELLGALAGGLQGALKAPKFKWVRTTRL